MIISLVNPPQTELREPLAYIPLGLGYIGAELIKNGFNNVRVDNLAGLGNNEFNDEFFDMRLEYADVFGITCMSAGLDGVRRVVNYIRDAYGEEGCDRSKIILGGPHPTVAPNDIAKRGISCDYVIRGEAEKLFVDIVRSLDKIGDIEKIRYARGIYNAGIIDELDMLPFPARRLFRVENVVSMSGIHGCEKGVRSSTVISSRGCPYSCRFCCRGHPMYSRYRYRSAENVRDELVGLREDYGIQHVRFVDDCFSLLKDRVKKICKYTKKLDMTFMCITRADTCNMELLKVLKDGGCTTVDIGVESGSNKLLRAMNKRETIEQMKQCIIDAKKVGLRTKVFLQYNLPGETEEDIQKTMDFLKEVKPDHYTLSKFTPLPGSEWDAENEGGSGYEGWFYNDSDEKRNRLINEIEGILYG